MKSIIIVPEDILKDTISALQKAGHNGCERVLLWLAEQGGNDVIIKKLYVPQQNADMDYFHIPRAGMVDLMKHIRAGRLMIASQVHSHPDRAFHSRADDEWAIIRHVGALSIVLPSFALKTNIKSFFHDAVVYELSENNEWLAVPNFQIKYHFRIEP